jgi:8-oxo-dGTP diphosphatase
VFSAGKLLVVVAAALVDAERRVLVQRRPAGKSMAGLWEFPGGKVESGESPEAALARELHEELGIGVAKAELRPLSFASQTLEDRHLLLLLYVARRWQGEPEALHAESLAWMPSAELRSLDMPPADRPLIAAIEAAL